MKFDNESQTGIQISKYLDGELSPVEREMLERHLGECGSCREVLQVFRRNEELLKNTLCVETYGNEITERVAKRIAAEARGAAGGEPAAKRVLAFLRRPAFGRSVAAAVMIALLAIVMLQNLTISRILERENKISDDVATLKEQLNLQWIATSKMEERRSRESAREAFIKAPGAGVIATVEGKHVSFAMKGPEGKEILHWDVSRRAPGQEGWPEPFSVRGSEIREPLRESGPVQYRFEPVLVSGERVEPFEVEVAPPPVLLNYRSPRFVATVRFLAFDEKTRLATFSVTRYGGAAGERTEAFQAEVGRPVGSIMRDRTGSFEDFRTGYVLADVERATQTIATTSTTGLAYTRENWKAVLRPAWAPEGDSVERVECWKDGSVEFEVRQQ
jgi:anti-sigma factor RsiW